MPDREQADRIRSGNGFIAALDQSGGSTPKALRLYGIGEDTYAGEDDMFDLIHRMRARIMQAPAFTGDKVIGAILFERTMDGEIAGKPTARYLWEERRVTPFLKVDKGLKEKADGVRLMKPIPGLEELLTRARRKGIFGTKARSVIEAAAPGGIAANVAQQFETGRQILAQELIPIIEPEVVISIPDKTEAEDILLEELHGQLDALPESAEVMLKLTLPTKANHYASLIDHPKVMRVVALSGGYSRSEANAKLAQNAGMTASFSRALVEGLSVGQSDAAFNAGLAAAIDSIHTASMAG